MGLARSVERREAGRLGLGEARRPTRGEGTRQADFWARLAGSGPSQRGAASFVKQGDGCGQRAGAVGSNEEAHGRGREAGFWRSSMLARIEAAGSRSRRSSPSKGRRNSGPSQPERQCTGLQRRGLAVLEGKEVAELRCGRELGEQGRAGGGRRGRHVRERGQATGTARTGRSEGNMP